MATIFPGATWRPMPGSSGRPKRRKGRGVGLHVAVYLGPSIYDINLGTGNDAHLYVRKDGSVEQNVDLDLVAYAGVDGNSSMIWVETEGGMGTAAQVDAELWTPPQAATLARIARWAHDTEGVPLQVMPDSRPTSRGVGTHRLGIDPWRVAGGESWSSHRGKQCPGAAKVAQVPAIVAAALGGPTQEDDMPLTADEKTELVTRVRDAILFTALNDKGQIGAGDGYVHVVDRIIGTDLKTGALNLLTGVAGGVAALLKIAQPAPVPVQGAIDYTRLAAAVCDEADRRARDGNPATGPAT